MQFFRTFRVRKLFAQKWCSGWWGLRSTVYNGAYNWPQNRPAASSTYLPPPPQKKTKLTHKLTQVTPLGSLILRQSRVPRATHLSLACPRCSVSEAAPRTGNEKKVRELKFLHTLVPLLSLAVSLHCMPTKQMPGYNGSKGFIPQSAVHSIHPSFSFSAIIYFNF